MARWFWLFGLLSACLLVTGCSGSKAPKPVQVSGTVNLDGQPLPDGSISFVGEVGTVPDVLPVKNGAFEGLAKPGKKKVEVLAYRPTKPPESATDTSGEFKENYLPERFNTNTTLTAEVTQGGVNPNKFDVQSK